MLRRNPQLAVPVVLAAELNYVWNWLRLEWLHQWLPSLMDSTSSQHSVLVGASDAGYWWAYVLSFTVSTGLRFVDVVCTVIALVMTGHWVRRLVVTEPAAQDELPQRAYVGGILRLSLLAFVLGTAGASLVAIPATYLAANSGRLSLLRSPWFALVIVPMYLLLAYFLTPMLLRLLALPRVEVIGPEEIEQGRKVALLAALVTAGVSVCQLAVAQAYEGTPSQHQAFGVLGTAVDSLPYIPLVVVLQLLAMRALESPTSAVTEPVGDLLFGEEGPVPEA